ncbi:MAG: sulfatase [Planctomycetes bacterium]|nr:sulfatase [Planctomycetota bacterium]
MDTTRADRCSFLGYAKPTTPALDAFAKECVVFTDAWSSGPWTIPAHAALFTGRRPVRLGVVKPWTMPLPESAATLAETLAGAGWKTGLFTCNAWIAPHVGLAQGFQKFDPVYLDAAGPSAHVAHDRALAWMVGRKSEAQPFFAFINDVDPHAPWNPPAKFAQQFLPPGTAPAEEADARTLIPPRTTLMYLGLEPFPESLRATVSGLYDAEIASLDSEIGRLFDGMRAAGLFENTMVIVLGDHGEGLADHGWLEHGILLHRELLHIPLLVRPVGGTLRREVSDVVRIEDVFPTVLDACGVPIPDGLDAQPILGTAADAPKGRVARANERIRLDYVEAVEKARSVTAAVPLRVARRSVYDGRHHLIADDKGRTELYDVKADPVEKHDLSAAQPDVVAALRLLLDPE